MSRYPMVPGHEIVGTVTGVGSAVSKFKVGDRAAVGCLVDSDRDCEFCKVGHEQFCPHMVLTYSGVDLQDESITQGGYSDHVVVRQGSSAAARELAVRCAAPVLRASRLFAAPTSRSARAKGCVAGMGVSVHGRKFALRWGHTCLITT